MTDPSTGRQLGRKTERLHTVAGWSVWLAVCETCSEVVGARATVRPRLLFRSISADSYAIPRSRQRTPTHMGIFKEKLKTRKGGDAHGNLVAIHTDRTVYFSGETIIGRIYLSVASATTPGLSIRRIAARLKGASLAKWTEEHHSSSNGKSTTTYSHYKGKSPFLESEVQLYDAAKQAALLGHSFDQKDTSYGVFPPGNYSYPFAFTLPHGIPNSYFQLGHHSNITKFKAKIAYKVYATIDTLPELEKGFFRDTRLLGVYAAQYIQVYAAPHAALDGARYDIKEEISAPVKNIGLISRGELKTATLFSSNVAVIGSTYAAHLKVDASACKKEAKEVVFKVEQLLHLVSKKDGHKRVVPGYGGVVCKVPGFADGERIEREFRVEIEQSRFAPSTDTVHVKVLHEAQVEVKMGMMAANRRMKIPLNVYMKSDYTVGFEGLVRRDVPWSSTSNLFMDVPAPSAGWGGAPLPWITGPPVLSIMPDGTQVFRYDEDGNLLGNMKVPEPVVHADEDEKD